MPYFSTPSTPAIDEKVNLGIREPFQMPKRKEGEELKEYVTALRPGAPFEYCTIGGINFEKRVVNADHSYVDKQEQPIHYGVLVKQLTDRQARSLQNRANSIVKEIPRRHNRNWKHDDPESPEYLPSYKTTLGEWLILCLKKEYNPMEEFTPPPDKEEEEEEEGDAAENLKAALIKEQKKSKSKG